MKSLPSHFCHSPSSSCYLFLPWDWKAPELTERKRREVRTHHPGPPLSFLLRHEEWAMGASPALLLDRECGRGPPEGCAVPQKE